MRRVSWILAIGGWAGLAVGAASGGESLFGTQRPTKSATATRSGSTSQSSAEQSAEPSTESATPPRFRPGKEPIPFENAEGAEGDPTQKIELPKARKQYRDLLDANMLVKPGRGAKATAPAQEQPAAEPEVEEGNFVPLGDSEPFEGAPLEEMPASVEPSRSNRETLNDRPVVPAEFSRKKGGTSFGDVEQVSDTTQKPTTTSARPFEPVRRRAPQPAQPAATPGPEAFPTADFGSEESLQPSPAAPADAFGDMDAEPELKAQPEFGAQPQAEPEFGAADSSQPAIEPQVEADAFGAGEFGEGQVETQAAPVVRPAMPRGLEPTTTPAVSETQNDPSSLTKVGEQIPSVSVRWVKRGQINIGQESHCELLVENTGEITARNISVDGHFPDHVRLVQTEPAGRENGDHLTWDIDEIAPGEKRAIKITLIPSQAGNLATTAFVRFTGASSSVFDVAEPGLELSARGSEEVSVGELVSEYLTLSNPGSGMASNVQIEARIPAGLQHPAGERLIMKVGALNPGETRTVRLALAAVEGGTHRLEVSATADGAEPQTVSREVNVIAPTLLVSVEGPEMRYIGRTARYVITAGNQGPASSNNVRVVHQVPEGFEFESADKGGQYDSDTRMITWFVGHLDAEQATSVEAQLVAKEPGEFTHVAAVVSEHGARKEAQYQTHVEGSPSLVVEIADLDDPIEVNNETAYEVRVKNEGTAPGQNIGISCELPLQVELVSAEGASEHIAEGGMVVFKSLRELAPGKTALYRVHVRGKAEGSHRFRVRLTSDASKEALVYEELTKFYAE